jgi:hypothetical protein
VHQYHIAPGKVEPGENDQLITGGDTIQPLGKRGDQLQPGLGRAFITLAGRLLATHQNGVDDPNWLNQQSGFFHRSLRFR